MSDNIQTMNKMNIELERMGTFISCPDLGKMRPINLAMTGLHYVPFKKKVRCHVCKVERCLIELEELQDIDVHRYMSPECPFVTGTYSKNIPVPEVGTEESLRIKQLLKDFCSRSNETSTTIGIQREYAETNHLRLLQQVCNHNVPSAICINGRVWRVNDYDVSGTEGAILENEAHEYSEPRSNRCQVWENDGPSALNINGNIWHLHSMFLVKDENGPSRPQGTIFQFLETDQLLPNPGSTSLDVYRELLQPVFRYVDGSIRLEGLHSLVI